MQPLCQEDWQCSEWGPCFCGFASTSFDFASFMCRAHNLCTGQFSILKRIICGPQAVIVYRICASRLGKLGIEIHGSQWGPGEKKRIGQPGFNYYNVDETCKCTLNHNLAKVNLCRLCCEVMSCVTCLWVGLQVGVIVKVLYGICGVLCMCRPHIFIQDIKKMQERERSIAEQLLGKGRSIWSKW